MFGLQFIAVNFLYLLFSLIVGIVTYVILSKKEKFTRPKRFGIGMGTFLVVWMLPFWDLLLQKGIKTYYETFMMESDIYAYPEKDQDGKIESLGVGEVRLFTVDYFTEHLKQKIRVYEKLPAYDLRVSEKNFQSWYEQKIQEYIEIGVYDDAKKVKLFRISYSPKLHIEPIKVQQAKYQIFGKSENGFFDLYKKSFIEFKDMEKNMTLATAWHLNFPASKHSFRNTFLLWKGPSGSAMKIKNFGNDDEIFKKLFGFPMAISVSNIHYNQQGEGENK